ncbi:MAG TPA: hypothetical protein VKY74_07285, partial [Chloroflexia bacterium]|nr:hypothetical protein [Chloroflexia bacterium]
LTPRPLPTGTATSGPAVATPETSNLLLRAAVAAMAQVHSYHYTSTVQIFDDGRPLAVTSAGDYLAPGGLHWSTAVSGITTTAVLTGARYLVAVGTGAWTEVPGGERERAHQLLWPLIGQAAAVTEVGRDLPTDPDPAIHLAFTLPPAALPLDKHPWQVAQGDVWLGLTDHRVRAFKLFAQEPRYETTERVFLSAFDAPVTVDLPVPTTPQPGLSGRLLYAHRDPGGAGPSSLRVRDLATGADTALELQLPEGHGTIDGAAWSPEGRRVLCSAGGVLFLIDLDGARVLNLGRGTAPAWAPDGVSVLFGRGAGRRTTLWTSDPLANDPHRLSPYFVQALDVAANGQLIFSGWAPNADPDTAPAQLFSMTPDGSVVDAFPALPGGAAGPRWSVDGLRIVLATGGHLALVDADGSHLVPLDATTGASAPLWSPDGTALVYAQPDSPPGPQRIVSRPVDGGPAQPLTAGDDLPLDWR